MIASAKGKKLADATFQEYTEDLGFKFFKKGLRAPTDVNTWAPIFSPTINCGLQYSRGPN